MSAETDALRGAAYGERSPDQGTYSLVSQTVSTVKKSVARI